MFGKERRRVILSVLLALCIIALTACTGGGPPSSQNLAEGEKELVVGMLGPFTGLNARIGDELKNAVHMAFSEIDYKVGDYRIRFVFADSESDAEKAARAYERMITQENIDVGFMNWHSWVSVAVMDIAADYEIPHFFTFGADKAINEKYHSDPERYKYWVGKAWPTAEKLIVGYVETIDSAVKSGAWTPRNKNFAVFGLDQDWGRSFGAALRDSFEERGWTCVTEEWFPLGETEFYPVLNKIRSLDVSLLVGTIADGPSGAAFVKQAREVNIPAIIVQDGLGWQAEWYDLTGDASNYILDQIPIYTSEQSIRFIEEYREMFGMDPSPSSSGMAYDYARFFIKVLETALELHGEITTETLTKVAVEQVKTGNLYFADGVVHKKLMYTPESIPDMVIGEDYYMFPVIQYMDGEMFAVWPDAAKQMDLRIPDFAR